MHKLIDNLEELGFGSQMEAQEFLELFNERYSYVYNISLNNSEVTNFLKEKHIRSCSIEQKVDYFYDHIMSQGLCEYVE